MHILQILLCIYTQTCTYVLTVSFICSYTQISTEEQRQEIVDFGNETEEWLYDEGRTADVSEFKTKHNTIR